VNVLDVRWYCAGHGNVGIVRVMTEYEGIRYYIGRCEGINEDVDSQYIADWGSRFPIEVGDVLFGVDEVKNGTAVQIPTNKEQAQLMVLLGTRFLEDNS
jgi:hypothetical protein